MRTLDNQELEDLKLDDLQLNLHLETLELHWHLLNPDLDLGLEKALKLERNLSQVMLWAFERTRKLIQMLLPLHHLSEL